MERRRAAITVGSRVTLKRPFTEEVAEGVVVERIRDTCLVACCGEEVEYDVKELEVRG